MATEIADSGARRYDGSMPASSLSDWNRKATRWLSQAIEIVTEHPEIKRLGPGAGPWEVEVLVAGETRVRRLNREYRGKDRPTDVLSFPPPPPVREMGYLGELVVCLPVARRQAGRLGLPLEVEVQVLLVHGLMHLLGLDHERGVAEARLQAGYEEEVLRELLPSFWAGRAASLTSRGTSAPKPPLRRARKAK